MVLRSRRGVVPDYWSASQVLRCVSCACRSHPSHQLSRAGFRFRPWMILATEVVIEEGRTSPSILRKRASANGDDPCPLVVNLFAGPHL